MFSAFQNELHSNQLFPNFGFNTVLFENDFKGIFAELFLVYNILLLLIYGVILSTSKEKKYPLLIGNIGWLGLLTLFLTFVLLIKNPYSHGLIFYNTLIIDQETQFFKIIDTCCFFTLTATKNNDIHYLLLVLSLYPNLFKEKEYIHQFLKRYRHF